jgi:hypothetical protein
MRIGYARVSTPDQSFTLQRDALEQSGCTKVFQEVASGAKAARPALTAALEYVRAGDTLVVWRLDRLGRSLGPLITLMQTLQSRQIGFQSLVEAIDTTTATGQFFFRSREPLRNSNGISCENVPSQAWRVRVGGDDAGAVPGRSIPTHLRWPYSSTTPRRVPCRASVRASAWPSGRSIAT